MLVTIGSACVPNQDAGHGLVAVSRVEARRVSPNFTYFCFLCMSVHKCGLCAVLFVYCTLFAHALHNRDTFEDCIDAFDWLYL